MQLDTPALVHGILRQHDLAYGIADRVLLARVDAHLHHQRGAAGGEVLAQLEGERGEAAVVPGYQQAARGARRREQRRETGLVQRGRLLDEDVLAGRERAHRLRRVLRVPGQDVDSV